ncbi:hypothetical protein D3C74_227990 [compost metagenome]
MNQSTLFQLLRRGSGFVKGYYPTFSGKAAEVPFVCLKRCFTNFFKVGNGPNGDPYRFLKN